MGQFSFLTRLRSRDEKGDRGAGRGLAVIMNSVWADGTLDGPSCAGQKRDTLCYLLDRQMLRDLSSCAKEVPVILGLVYPLRNRPHAHQFCWERSHHVTRLG